MSFSKTLLASASALALALAVAPAAAQFVKIPQLPDAGALTGNELMILDQNVSTRKATIALVAAYISAHLPPILSPTGDASQVTVLTFGNKTTNPTFAGAGLGMPLTQALNATYALGTKDDPNSSILGSSNNYPYPIFSITPPTSEADTHTALYDHIRDNPAGETKRVFAHTLTYETNTGGDKAVGDLSGERVNTYFGTRGLPGAGSIWALNSQTHLYPGYTGPGAAGYEIDVTNQAQHRGDGFGEVDFAHKYNSVGLAINSLSRYRNATGGFVAGVLEDGTPAWNRGWICSGGSINIGTGGCFIDYSGAYASFSSYGGHQFAFDATNATPNIATIGSQVGANAGWNFYDSNKAIHTQLYDDGSSLRSSRGIGAPSFTGNYVAGLAGTSLFASGNYADPGPGVTFDAKFGGSGGGIAVKGISQFGSDVQIAGSMKAQTFFESLATPASSSQACVAGQFTDDANYHYVCVATNKWRRGGLSDF